MKTQPKDLQDETLYYQTDKIGWLKITAGPGGIKAIDFVEGPQSVSKITNPHLRLLKKELDAYFQGKLTKFSAPLNIEHGTEFQRKVWDALQAIPYGKTRSYAEIADAIENPKAMRAVGSANKSNCMPIIIPCHRVIKSGGALGGYGGGLDKKKALLELEGLKISAHRAGEDTVYQVAD
jgi:methylated-DNA-[protein]-cysteine S-methyltransferase